MRARLGGPEALLGAFGVAVSDIPALAAFLHSHARGALNERARTAHAGRLELLF